MLGYPAHGPGGHSFKAVCRSGSYVQVGRNDAHLMLTVWKWIVQADIER